MVGEDTSTKEGLRDNPSFIKPCVVVRSPIARKKKNPEEMNREELCSALKRKKRLFENEVCVYIVSGTSWF